MEEAGREGEGMVFKTVMSNLRNGYVHLHTCGICDR